MSTAARRRAVLAEVEARKTLEIDTPIPEPVTKVEGRVCLGCFEPIAKKTWCATCAKARKLARTRAWQVSNPEKVNRARKNNPEKARLWSRLWGRKHRSMIRDMQRALRIIEPEKYKARRKTEKYRKWHRERMRHRRAADPEKYRKYQRELRARDPEKANARARAWRAANPDKVRQYSKQYYEIAEHRARSNAWKRTHRAANIEKALEQERERYAKSRAARLANLVTTPCNRCGAPVEHPATARLPRLCPFGTECRRAYQLEAGARSRDKHRDKRREKAVGKRADNREKLREKARVRLSENREKINAQKRAAWAARKAKKEQS